MLSSGTDKTDKSPELTETTYKQAFKKSAVNDSKVPNADVAVDFCITFISCQSASQTLQGYCKRVSIS